jgi:hypothetical protein
MDTRLESFLITVACEAHVSACCDVIPVLWLHSLQDGPRLDGPSASDNGVLLECVYLCVLEEFLLMLLLCGGFVPFNISMQHKQLLHRIGVVLVLKGSVLCCIVTILVSLDWSTILHTAHALLFSSLPLKQNNYPLCTS